MCFEIASCLRSDSRRLASSTRKRARLVFQSFRGSVWWGLPSPFKVTWLQWQRLLLETGSTHTKGESACWLPSIHLWRLPISDHEWAQSVHPSLPPSSATVRALSISISPGFARHICMFTKKPREHTLGSWISICLLFYLFIHLFGVFIGQVLIESLQECRV